jgi:hypothetical protein
LDQSNIESNVFDNTQSPKNYFKNEQTEKVHQRVKITNYKSDKNLSQKQHKLDNVLNRIHFAFQQKKPSVPNLTNSHKKSTKVTGLYDLNSYDLADLVGYVNGNREVAIKEKFRRSVRENQKIYRHCHKHADSQKEALEYVNRVNKIVLGGGHQLPMPPNLVKQPAEANSEIPDSEDFNCFDLGIPRANPERPNQSSATDLGSKNQSQTYGNGRPVLSAPGGRKSKNPKPKIENLPVTEATLASRSKKFYTAETKEDTLGEPPKIPDPFVGKTSFMSGHSLNRLSHRLRQNFRRTVYSGTDYQDILLSHNPKKYNRLASKGNLRLSTSSTGCGLGKFNQTITPANDPLSTETQSGLSKPNFLEKIEKKIAENEEIIFLHSKEKNGDKILKRNIYRNKSISFASTGHATGIFFKRNPQKMHIQEKTVCKKNMPNDVRKQKEFLMNDENQNLPEFDVSYNLELNRYQNGVNGYRLKKPFLHVCDEFVELRPKIYDPCYRANKIVSEYKGDKGRIFRK